MRRLFVDSFFWIALFDPRDNRHRQAVALAQALNRVRRVTTQEVLSEVLTYFAAFGATKRREVARAIRDIERDSGTEVVPQTAESFAAGLALYEDRLDKEYSLADCISMNAMRARGITEALTHDHHFVQEGFIALMRDE